MAFSLRDAAFAESARYNFASNSERNAFRHALWMSWVTMAVGGRFARQLGQAHEADTVMANPGDGAKFLDSVVDLFNNEFGIGLGEFYRQGGALLVYGRSPGSLIYQAVLQCRAGYDCGLVIFY